MSPNSKPPLYAFSTTQWIAWLAAACTSVVLTTVWAFAQFETKEHAKETRDISAARLERIENKLDRLLEESRRSSR